MKQIFKLLFLIIIFIISYFFLAPEVTGQHGGYETKKLVTVFFLRVKLNIENHGII